MWPASTTGSDPSLARCQRCAAPDGRGRACDIGTASLAWLRNGAAAQIRQRHATNVNELSSVQHRVLRDDRLGVLA